MCLPHILYAVEQYYAGCEEALDIVNKAVTEHPDLDDASIAAWYTETTGLPMQRWIVC